MKKLHKSISILILLAMLLAATNALAAPGDTTRVSVDSSGVQGNGDSFTSFSSSSSSISSDGHYAAFISVASNLVAEDSNGAQDVFVHDRTTGTTMRASVGMVGTQGNSDSSSPSISSDGRYVVFDSRASNLVAEDTNGRQDVFVHDRTTGTTTRISVDSSGAQGNSDLLSPSISSDGRYVAFISNASNLVTGEDTNGMWGTFVYDRATSITTRVSVGGGGTLANSDSYGPSISADGRYVAFISDASLVAGDLNGMPDVFVCDRILGTTTLVSASVDGSWGNSPSYFPSISSDGRFVAFTSYASNLVAGDTNGWNDVFVYDRAAKIITRVSVDSSGVQANRLSGDATISSDGRYVAFSSFASNLVAGDTNGKGDAFLHDRTTGTTVRISVGAGGMQGDDHSYSSSISSDGRYVAFWSHASNLVVGDTNEAADVFVHELDFIAPLVVSTSLSASYTGTSLASFIVNFSENVNNVGGGAGTDDAANPANYRVINKGANGLVDTGSCADPLTGDDMQMTVSGVVYTPNTAKVSLASSLPAGKYRLSVCGTTSIVDLAGNPLNGGADYTFDFEVLPAPVSPTLPRTGFAPDVVTLLPSQPGELAYTPMSDLWLEIPSQKITANIVGVPQSENGWDVKWLSWDAGWLNGTAFPTWEGNSVITAHVTDEHGLPGPFANLKDLNYGEQVIVHLNGQQYIFEVHNKRLVRPETTNFAFQHLEKNSYLTLITCQSYDPATNSYRLRRIIRAVLVEVK